MNPLFNAIMHCDANMVRLLIEVGADVNQKDVNITPWSLATYPDSTYPDFWEIREILKAAGAVL